MSSAHHREDLSRALAAGGFVLLLLCFFSMLLGAGDLTLKESAWALFGRGDDKADFVVWSLRLPRTLLALVVGVALGAAGVSLQAATRNPLAEPGLLGVSAGASFLVVLSIWLGLSNATMHLAVAITGSVIGCLLVLAVTQLRGPGSDPVRLVLAGAAFTGILMAGSTLILLYDQRTADEIRFWIIGALGGREASTLIWALPSILAGLVILLALLRPLAAMALGEKVATGLGHKPGLTRVLVLMGVAVLVGTATAAAGPISFVGLIVPFIARRLVGPDIRRSFVVSLLYGPCIVLFADIVSRLVVKPYELPIGVVTAFVGAPVLIAVVRSHRLPRL